MFIRAGRRFNIYASATIENVTYPNFTDPALQAQFGITEEPEPEAPQDYSEDLYFKTEIDEAPYVLYEAKPAEMVAAVRWEKLKAIRDELTDFGGCLVGDKWYHTDPKSKIQFIGLTIAGQNISPTLMWKTLDGSFVNMTPTLVLQIFAAQAAREQAIFAVAEVKRLDTSDIYTGWPDRYVPTPPEEEEPQEP